MKTPSPVLEALARRYERSQAGRTGAANRDLLVLLEDLLAEAGCNGLQVGGARFAPKHANFIENTGGASTAEIVALIAAGRELVRGRFGVELEPEVQLLGEVRFPW